jgi:hypothetical protein
MAERTALLICCSQLEAKTIRAQAKTERRTVSGYVLNILSRILSYEERFDEQKLSEPKPRRSRPRSIGPRTAVLVRCSMEEARRIRAKAESVGGTVSSYVVTRLRWSWRGRGVALGA